MSVDKLQEKIRKLKNPTVIDLTVMPETIPPCILQEQGDFCDAYKVFAKALLDGLKEIVPAVRFDFGSFALLGSKGLETLEEVLKLAKDLGYYVLLSGVDVLSAQSAEHAATVLLSGRCKWYFHGLILTAYIGSDALKPYVSGLKDSGKTLFVVARTANKTAPEIQDLLTGSRLVHVAKTDIINRFAEPLMAKCGYSQVAVMAAASSADSLRTLRTKYKYLFLLLDGCDYPNANAKNCSFAFDRLGHGAAACAGSSVTAAWQDEPQADYVTAAVNAAQRLKKNLNRYVTIL